MKTLPWQEEREVVVKYDAETDPSLGCNPYERPVDELLYFGVVNLNKPKGPTSHLAADYVKKILHVEKAGHGGSLDPGVTGVLPVALGRATRAVQSLLKAGKEYVAIVHLHKPVEENKIREAFEKFVGKITQLPPIKSAVKRQLRERTVYYLEILEIDGQDVLFRMGCQAGTYVRKVCHDLGQELGVGAHMAELVRTKAGPFTDKDWVTLQDLEDAYAYWKEGEDKFIRYCVQPAERIVTHLPKIWIQDSAVDTICHGATLKVPGIVKLETKIEPDRLVAVMTLKDELVCLGRAKMTTEQMEKETKGLAVKPEAVLMKAGTYKHAE
ncbi:RNA-guided pseudouridylation complex pseudouridine synthase subunit Cbf5 [Candidatus Woesearchaeota archaeon]|nr:RNA-guided pseudouridylation complex pseudouridine synthase subunit Cbf5 [Candidatus Woesearchaeota archaeon]